MTLSIPKSLLTAAAGAAAASAVFLTVGQPSSTAHRGTTPTAVVAKTTKTNATTVKASTTPTKSTAPTETSTTPTQTGTAGESASQIYQGASDGIVAIDATSSEEDDSGTGVVLNDDGLILTNNHVVSDATTITVSPGNQSKETRTATLVGADPDADLAVLKINPAGLDLHPLKLGNSSDIKVGDAVYAIGNPYGLNETLTTGVVSALNRQIQAPDGATISGVIQTDAALNPGNSGGPLLNAQGQVIGINSQIASEETDIDGEQPGSTGVGFAISSNTVASVVAEIEKTGGSIQSTQPQTSTETPSTTTSPYGSDPYGQGGSSTDPYGGGTDPYGSSGTDPYGSSGTDPYDTDPYGAGGYGYGGGGYGGGGYASAGGSYIVVPGFGAVPF